MKYIKKNLQIAEPAINEEGYYIVGNVAIHPDVFHRDYQPLGFSLTPEEVEVVEAAFVGIIPIWKETLEFLGFPEEKTKLSIVYNLLNRIKQYQDENR